MSVLWRKTEFYKGESDRKVIIIAAGSLGEGAASLPQQAGSPIMGVLPSYQIFSPTLKSLSSPYCYLKWHIDVNKKELKFESQNELILKGTLRNFLPVKPFFYEICNLKTFSPLPSTEFLVECHEPTDQTLMENPVGSRKEP